MHKGLQFQVNYTLGDARSNYSDLLSSGGFGGFRGYDLEGWGGLDNEWRLAYFHVKHAFTFSGGWEIPLKGAVLGGWRFNWIATAYEGKHDITQFYNPSAFRDPAVATSIGQTDFTPLGGEGTQVTGPPFRQLDVGLAKQFQVGGGRRMEFRAEAYNLTNTPSFNLPTGTNFSNTSQFGQITTQRNRNRQIQLGLKLYF
jgi:hypothetical protein